MGVSVGVGSGVFVAGTLVAVGGNSGVEVSLGALVQAERNTPRDEYEGDYYES